MPWFKVDDDLAFHRKAVAAGNAAMGLWVRAGAWSAQHLTDGFVPDHILALLGTAPQRKKLISVRLWIDVSGGVQFHEWNENGRQPTAKAVRTEREKAAERQRAWRAAKSGRYTENPENNQVNGASHSVSHGVSNGVSHGVTPPLVTPDPTRPDPTRTSYGSTQEKIPPDADASGPPTGAAKPKTKRASRLPNDFAVTPEMVAWAKANVPNVDGRVETEKFRDHWASASGANSRKLDWIAAWRNWMRNADQRAPNGRGHLAIASGQGPVPQGTSSQRANAFLALRKGDQK